MFFLGKIKISPIIDFIYISGLIIYSFFLGSTYSKYHTDPWHWGSIASNSIDYINGLKLFKDIVLLWGPGQPILYNIINHFYNINYYSIGIVTSITYCLNLLFSYLIIKKLSNRIIAITISFSIFCLLPYPQTPWPDFYSGLCLVISCYCLAKENKSNLIIFISSFFLTLSIIFRNTYILEIIPAIFSFYLLCVIQKKEVPKVFKKYFLYFFILLIFFIIILLIQGDLNLWYKQGIGRVNEYQYTNNVINGITINPFIFSIIKFIFHIFFPSRLEGYYYLILFLFNCVIIMLCFFKKKFFEKIIKKNCNLIFFSILGFFGIIQSFNQYEVWRNINSSVSIFFVIAYFLYNFVKNSNYVNIGIIISLIPLLPVANKNNGWKHYNGTNYFPVKGYFLNERFIEDEKFYFKSNILFFNEHKFNQENIQYYKEIKSLICQYDKIINFSVDRTLTYICDKKNQIVSTYPRNNGKPIFNSFILENKYMNDNIEINEIIIADKDFSNKNLKLIKKIKIPNGTRYTYADNIMRYFDDEIYFYTKN